MSETHDGGCLCGAVRWRATGAPKNVNHCHCEMCRRAGGSAFATWATFAAENFSYTKGAPTWRQSSSFARRGFCASCGSALHWQHLQHPDSIDVTVGTADNPSALLPREHLWTESQIAWLHFADDLPRHPLDRGSGG
jgi:hypothetical protein